MATSRTLIRGVELAWEFSSASAVAPATSASAPLPFVWAHGGNSSRAEEDRFALLNFAALGTAMPVLRYDARAHGESGLSSEPTGYRWDALAHDQLALAEAVGVDRYCAGGASLGAGTVLFAAVLAPERIERLVIVTPPTGWEVRDAQRDFYLALANMIDRDGMAPIIEGARSATPPDPLVGRDRINEVRAESVTRADPHRLATFYRGTSLANMPSRELIAQIEAPTLILAWTGDPVHPVSTANELAELMPHATLAVASTWYDLQSWTDQTSDFLSSAAAG